MYAPIYSMKLFFKYYYIHGPGYWGRVVFNFTAMTNLQSLDTESQ